MPKEITPRPDLFTRKEAAVYLRRSMAWLAKHAKTGQGPKCTWFGNRALYFKEDLDAFLDDMRRNTPTPTHVAVIPKRRGRPPKNAQPVSTSDISPEMTNLVMKAIQQIALQGKPE